MLFRSSSRFYLLPTLLNFTLLFLLITIQPVIAENNTERPKKASTIDNPFIDIDELQIILNPMTKDELIIEADGWLILLQQAAEKVSSTKLEISKDNRKISRNKAVKETKEMASEKTEEQMQKISQLASVEEQEKEDLSSEIKDVNVKIKEDVSSEVEDELKKVADAKKENKDKKETIALDADSPESTKVTSLEDKKINTSNEHKEDSLAVLDKFRQDRRKIIERFNVVLSEINRKIGLDAEGNELDIVLPYRRYIDAVSGIRLNLSDTKSTWLSLKGYILSDDGGMKWLLNMSIFLGTLFVFWILSLLLSNTVKKALGFTHSNSKILNDFFVRSIRRITMIVGILVALSAIGVSIAPIMAVIGAASFVVAFALQSTLSNFASGIMIMFYRPFDMNDWVEVAGIMGTVKSMTLVSTTIMTADNKLMIVPNNSIWTNVITNSHASIERRVDMVFRIAYDNDIAQSIQVMTDVLKAHPLVMNTPKAIIQVNELAESSVNFICRPWVKTKDYWTVYWDITRAMKEQFDVAGISIPYPQTDINIYQQNSHLKQEHTQ